MRRHETDFFSLAAGLLFTALGILLAISAATGWQLDGRWLAPAVLIVLGAGGVAASLAATRRARAAEVAQPGSPAEPAPQPEAPWA